VVALAGSLEVVSTELSSIGRIISSVYGGKRFNASGARFFFFPLQPRDPLSLASCSLYTPPICAHILDNVTTPQEYTVYRILIQRDTPVAHRSRLKNIYMCAPKSHLCCLRRACNTAAMISLLAAATCLIPPHKPCKAPDDHFGPASDAYPLTDH